MKKIALAFSMILMTFVGSQSGIASQKSEMTDLLNNLKKGGYIVYMRHPQTDKSQRDTDIKNLASCDTQRNLSNVGRETAGKIGQAIKSLDVKFSVIKTSEYCRARQVPELMGIKTFEITPDLNHSGNMEEPAGEQQVQKLRTFFAEPPKGGMNTLLIGHSPNVIAMDPNLISKGFKSGDMLVLKPKADKSGYTFVGRIAPKDWDSLKVKLASRNK
ncbi:MAG: hypothetical protein AAF228_01585 [Pseudomonadota bacterium]